MSAMPWATIWFRITLPTSRTEASTVGRRGTWEVLHKGKHPELKDKVVTPDVISNPHNASREMTFYTGKQFPAGYQGDNFACEHRSWNRSARAGYELIRMRAHQTGHATDEYEDFMAGFVVDNGHVGGRPTCPYSTLSECCSLFA